MSIAFTRSMRALQGDRFGRVGRGLLVVAVLVAAWLGWFLFSTVGLYEESPLARLEVDRASYPVAASVGGRVVVSNLALDKKVAVGDPLIVLDAEIERRQMQEEEALLAGVERQATTLRNSLSSARRGRSESSSASSAAVQEANARLTEAESEARFAADRLRRLSSMTPGSVAEIDIERARTDAETKRAAVEARRLELSRLDRQNRADQSDRQTELDRIEHDIAELDGKASAYRASIARLREEIERRTIRASINGTLGEVKPITPGSILSEGERVGAIVPEGRLRAVAEFPPPSAFGRIRPGQTALLRLAGFPWTQYGGVPATVARVASEVRDGLVRVEFTLNPDPASTIPLQHGLPGSVEVEIDRLSPAALLLRVAGTLLTRDEPEDRREASR